MYSEMLHISRPLELITVPYNVSLSPCVYGWGSLAFKLSFTSSLTHYSFEISPLFIEYKIK